LNFLHISFGHTLLVQVTYMYWVKFGFMYFGYNGPFRMIPKSPLQQSFTVVFNNSFKASSNSVYTTLVGGPYINQLHFTTKKQRTCLLTSVLWCQ